MGSACSCGGKKDEDAGTPSSGVHDSATSSAVNGHSPSPGVAYGHTSSSNGKGPPAPPARMAIKSTPPSADDTSYANARDSDVEPLTDSKVTSADQPADSDQGRSVLGMLSPKGRQGSRQNSRQNSRSGHLQKPPRDTSSTRRGRGSRASRQPVNESDPPHPIDERVDACYGMTAAHRALMTRVRDQLRKEGNYQPWLDNDHVVMRFLSARAYDYKKGLEMLRNCVRWRLDNNVDSVLDTWHFTERREVKRWYPYTHHKVDKVGRVVYIEQVGKINFAQLEKVTSFERLIESFIYDAELTMRRRLPAAARVAGHPVDKILTIIDLDGFRISMFDQRSRDYLTRVSQMASDYYPEQLGTMFIVNAPIAFRVVWQFMKALLDSKTQQKIKIYSSTGYQEELLRYVAADSLPRKYGGQDDSCDFVTERGPWIDDDWERNHT
mmetsp:Transcript_21607/g.72684  ORF Transcript_21607/g.72684 Transcript_21607/m.72684 type:complete len:438 (+) Transcript_21607:98-1411(+)